MYGKVFYHVKLYVYGYTNNLRGLNELWRGHVTAARHTSAEWYLFGGFNVLVVTTFRTGLLLFPLLFIVITRTWWVWHHLLFSRQLTSATWKISFLQHFLRVRYWYWFGERRLSPNQYQYLTYRILHKVPRESLSSPWQLPPRLLWQQESLLLPTRYVQFLLGSCLYATVETDLILYYLIVWWWHCKRRQH
jgi:hypothetical protein